jgi:hypothetical protein
MARDEMPDNLRSGSPAPSGREHEANEQLKKLRTGVELLLEKLDLSDEVRHHFYDLLRQTEPRSLYGTGPNANLKHKGAKDVRNHHRSARDDDDVEAFIEFLRGRGLDEEAIEEARRIVERYEHPASDKLPVSALRGGYGGRLSGATRDDLHERAETFEKFPGLANIKPDYSYREANRRPSAADRKLAYDAGDAEQRLLKKFGPDGPGRVGLGMWPKRAPA